MLENFKDRRVLLLQGPLGPFFRRFGQELQSHGAHVTRVNFCGGDQLYSGGASKVLAYTDTLYNWPSYLKKLLKTEKIDAIFLLGDMRPYHQVAHDAAKGLDVEIYVFEEGYLRPDFITLEKDGVNGNSKMSRFPDFYLKHAHLNRLKTLPVGPSFNLSAWITVAYYCAMFLMGWRYRHYVHHRDVGPLWHGFRWVRGLWRKYYYRAKESRILAELTDKWSKKFYLFPLQVHNDYQFKHADYENIEACIAEVIASFAKHAPRKCLLVIKHHPADRPYRDYTALIERLTIEHGIRERVLYIHDLHLPTLLKHARGTVLMNSTVGLQSIHYATPVLVLGRAIYKLEGLTARGSLNDFWRHQSPVDMKLYAAFRAWLENHNQFNGNFYRRIPGLKNPTGVVWHSVPK